MQRVKMREERQRNKSQLEEDRTKKGKKKEKGKETLCGAKVNCYRNSQNEEGKTAEKQIPVGEKKSDIGEEWQRNKSQ